MAKNAQNSRNQDRRKPAGPPTGETRPEAAAEEQRSRKRERRFGHN
ncbi:hypothetical protein ACL02R_24135 [Streptomyces sp. MS19]